jgi:queuine tRNA-ribosyltransferase
MTGRISSSGSFSFRLLATDAQSAARRSVFSTPHGDVELPAFMPVGTQATVKGLTIDALAETGAQMVLANTYHLALRPGAEVVAELGGLHAFSGWQGPMLTDSGGFQIFSLAHNAKITEEQATFRSHIDGNLFELSPERAVAIQEQLGADVIMALDHVVALPNEDVAVREATERSVRWARRCQQAQQRDDQALFAIVQGGLDPELRANCARQLAELEFPGYAIGGLSVGEQPIDMYRMIEATVPALPADRPRYLMGVGRPQDLLEAIGRGVDLFDCVLPTRNARNAMAFTDDGPIRLRNLQFERDLRPLAEGCPCAACRHSRGYLRHLFLAHEMLGPILVSIHNVTYYQRLMADAREAIGEGKYGAFAQAKLARLTRGDS